MDSEIEAYKEKIARHEQRIEQIEAGQGLAAEATLDQKIAMVKAEQDQIRACETAINTLRQQQQQRGSSSSSGRCFTFR